MTANAPIRVLVSHADPLTKAGLSSALQSFPDFEVVVRAAVDVEGPVDVLAADYGCGMEYLSTPRAAGDHARVLIITASDSECDIRQALKQGVRGYVLQGCSLEELAGAVRDTFDGSVHLCPRIAQRLAESIYGNALTAREEEVLRCVVEGLCNREVAKRLDLSVGTVKSHLRAVYAKLDVKSRTHAVAVAARRGILQSNRPSTAPSVPSLRPVRRVSSEALAHGNV
jgi:DNA-binding NarL/FixJ family response regulator